ncbi:MAG TPA: PGPGW domain-containing protein [Acidimicrobiia bacterium]|nr:PGPGW domain-containing protein [Acidimicrobiia bacterium]
MAQRQGSVVDVRAIGRFLLRGTRRAAVTLVGFTVVAVGLAGLLLPILPGWALIIAGLLVLSREYSWAYNALAFARRHATRGGESLRSMAGRARGRRTAPYPSGEVVIDLTQTTDVSDSRALDEADEEISATG